MLVGNLLASIAMLWYFLRAHRALPRTLIGSWGGVLWEGVVTGIVGAAVVAIWFFAIDAIRGEPLRTPKLLGIALLRQADPGSAILAYTLLHGLAFVLFGILGAFLVAAAERQPVILFALIIVFTAFEIFFFGAVVILAQAGSLLCTWQAGRSSSATCWPRRPCWPSTSGDTVRSPGA